MINDWATKAARKIISEFPIHDYYENLSEERVAAIIASHVPFTSETAYMEVPRCDQCQHWSSEQKDKDGRQSCTNVNVSPHQMDEFMTMPNFGCVQWEKK